MVRITLKATLASLVTTAVLMVAAWPGVAHATASPTAPPFQHDTLIDQHPVVYIDPFSSPGVSRTDRAIGSTTHWEGSVDLSNPRSTLTWTRVADSGVAALASTTGGERRMLQPQGLLHHHSRTISYGTCGSGGARIYQHAYFQGGDCVAFYGSGDASLSILYPGCYVFCSHVNDSLEAMSTQGSMGTGYLVCAYGHHFDYTNQKDYPDLRQVIGGDCWHNAGSIHGN